MPFKSVADIAAAYDNGRWHHQRVFRNTSIYCTAGLFTDYSMSGGTPKYNAYIGNQLESTALVGSGNNGIYTGPTPAAGMTKHIAKIAVNTMSTNVPVQSAELRDLLMFYPLIDGDSTDLQEMVQVDERSLRLSVSIGIAVGRAQHRTIDELLHDADVALYRAKEGGRQRFVLFDDREQRAAMDVLQVEHELRDALQAGQLVPYFQPIVRLCHCMFHSIFCAIERQI